MFSRAPTAASTIKAIHVLMKDDAPWANPGIMRALDHRGLVDLTTDATDLIPNKYLPKTAETQRTKQIDAHLAAWTGKNMVRRAIKHMLIGYVADRRRSVLDHGVIGGSEMPYVLDHSRKAVVLGAPIGAQDLPILLERHPGYDLVVLTDDREAAGDGLTEHCYRFRRGALQEIARLKAAAREAGREELDRYFDMERLSAGDESQEMS